MIMAIRTQMAMPMERSIAAVLKPKYCDIAPARLGLMMARFQSIVKDRAMVARLRPRLANARLMFQCLAMIFQLEMPSSRNAMTRIRGMKSCKRARFRMGTTFQVSPLLLKKENSSGRKIRIAVKATVKKMETKASLRLMRSLIL